MFKEIGQFASLLKQAQGMQGKMADSKARLEALRVVGESGGGMVAVTISGAMRLLGCKIDPTLLQSGDVEMLEDLVVAATNQALEKLVEQQAQEMTSITGGINVPGLTDALTGMGFGKS